ncbi:MAG: aldo/keto reductase, partial [Actinomycetota bacterium]|nr:aldo/keto reductase [Actinomycetota bacterium]
MSARNVRGSTPAAADTAVVALPGTGITTSRLGFGCAELYREPSGAQRRRLLDRARHAGISHFDVAPMYGLGIAERELGAFASRRRDQVVIATKFGISPSLAARAIGRVQGPARRLLAASQGLRSRARSSAPGPASGGTGSLLYRASGFDATAARASLERSLRELRTDYVDLLLLHDPEPGQVDGDGLCSYLEQLRTTGQIRSWGVAGEPGPTLRVASELPVMPGVIQVRDDLLEGRRSVLPTTACITFGVLGRVLGAVGSHLAADQSRRRAWGKAVGIDCGDRELLAGLLLRWASRANPDGVVLFGTISVDHIAAGAAAIASAHGDLDAFAELVDSE